MKKKNNDFGLRLEQKCKAEGISVNQLAKTISVSAKTVYGWIGANARLPREPMHIKALSQALGVSVNWLLFGEEEQPVSIDSLFSKAEIHTGTYTITISRVEPKK